MITQYSDMSSLIIVLQLASSPSLFYRTADDDIAESVPFDLLDDEISGFVPQILHPVGQLVGAILTMFLFLPAMV